MNFAEKFNHISLQQKLREQEELSEEHRQIKLHKYCQRYVYNENKKRTVTTASLLGDNRKQKILRSSMVTFDWKRNCMFCGKACQRNVRNPDRNTCHEVTTLHFKDQVVLACQKRDDQISKEVALRVRSCHELVAEEARYHTSCRITFINSSKALNAGGNNVNLNLYAITFQFLA